MYRELFYNNVDSFIATGFPVLRQILPDPAWSALVGDFFARHRCQTPYFTGFAEEFLAYLASEREPNPEDPPFLLELAHYEWVELALAIAEDAAPPLDTRLADDPLTCLIDLSPLAWPLAYRYPVHRIGREFQPTEPPAQPTCLAVYRDREDQVHFLELNPVTYRLLQLLQESSPRPAKACLEQIAEELGHADPRSVIHHGVAILQDLARRGLIARLLET